MQAQSDYDGDEERLASLPLFSSPNSNFDNEDIEVDEVEVSRGQGQNYFGGQQQPHSSSGYSSSSIESHLLLSSPGDSDDNIDSIAKEISVSVFFLLHVS